MINTEDVVAVGPPPMSNAIKQSSVAVSITIVTWALNAEVLVAPLEVVADKVCVTPGLKTLLMSIISFTL